MHSKRRLLAVPAIGVECVQLARLRLARPIGRNPVRPNQILTYRLVVVTCQFADRLDAQPWRFNPSISCTSFLLSTCRTSLGGVDAGIHHSPGAGEFHSGIMGIFAPALTLMKLIPNNSVSATFRHDTEGTSARNAEAALVRRVQKWRTGCEAASACSGSGSSPAIPLQSTGPYQFLGWEWALSLITSSRSALS